MNCSECDSLQNTQWPTPSHREILFWPTPFLKKKNRPGPPPHINNDRSLTYNRTSSESDVAPVSLQLNSTASEPEIRTNPYLPPGTYNSQDIRFGWLPPARLIFKFPASRNLTSRERPLLAGKYLK